MAVTEYRRRFVGDRMPGSPSWSGRQWACLHAFEITGF